MSTETATSAQGGAHGRCEHSARERSRAWARKGAAALRGAGSGDERARERRRCEGQRAEAGQRPRCSERAAVLRRAEGTRPRDAAGGRRRSEVDEGVAVEEALGAGGGRRRSRAREPRLCLTFIQKENLMEQDA